MTIKDKLIKGKVARILNSRELAINIGKKDGVYVGMKFDILDQKGEEIKDPDTNEILGSLLCPKVRVKVVEVQENLSVASTYKKEEINIGGSGKAELGISRMSTFLLPPKWITVYETLKTKEKTWEDLDEKENYVKIGDSVIQISVDDE